VEQVLADVGGSVVVAVPAEMASPLSAVGINWNIKSHASRVESQSADKIQLRRIAW
jgi:hypothetical protein